jgi:hypothetical protein
MSSSPTRRCSRRCEARRRWSSDRQRRSDRLAQFLIVDRDPEAVIASASDPERATGVWIELTSKLLDDLQSLDAGRWLAAGYERLLADVRQELLRVCRFLGIPLPEVSVSVPEPPPPPRG